MLYHKKIDKSFFKYGFTVPVKYIEIFLCGEKMDIGSSRDIKLTWGGKKYDIKMYHIDRKQGAVYQIRWDQNPELVSEFKKEYIQSYFAIESQNFEAKEKGEYYMSSPQFLVQCV